MENSPKKIKLPRKAAREMFYRSRLGDVYLVRNKDGKCYFVDHGCTGKPVKREEQWEDPEYGFNEYVFLEAKYDYPIVAWSDDEPLDIDEYLIREGWMKKVGSEWEFVTK